MPSPNAFARPGSMTSQELSHVISADQPLNGAAMKKS
jgi:hypothetical protein